MHFNLTEANEAAQHERGIGALTARTGIPPAEVRALYAQEFARLARGATVRSYLALRTTSNVLAMLRRRRNAHEDPRQPSPDVDGEPSRQDGAHEAGANPARRQ